MRWWRSLRRSIAGQTTGRTLWWLATGLVLAGVLALAGSVLALARVHEATEAIDRIARSEQLVVLTQESLVQADNAVIASFHDGTAAISGPGRDYENEMATAGRRLAQLAENNADNTVASQRIQVAQGLVISYVGFVAQANAHFRQAGDQTLAIAYLGYASRLLKEEIVGQLNDLRRTNQADYNQHFDAGPGHWFTWLLWLLPVVVVLVGLVWVQVRLARRFRRTLSVWFVLATALAFTVGIVADAPRQAGNQLRQAQRSVDAYGEASGPYINELRALQQYQLTSLMQETCPVCVVDSSAAATTAKTDPPSFEQAQRALDAVNAGSIGWTVALALLATMFIGVGFVPRLLEYQR